MSTHQGVLEVLHVLHLRQVLAEVYGIFRQSSQVCLEGLEDLREEREKS